MSFRLVKVASAIIVFMASTIVACFSTTPSNPPRSMCFQPLSTRPSNHISPLFIGTGFSFDDGNQVLVSVQKPLGIFLEQDEQGSNSNSIVVIDIDTFGSAARAGVKVGDILVAVQNASVENQSLEDVLDFIGQAPRVVNLRFMRTNDGD